MCRALFKPNERLEPCAIDETMGDGDTLPIAGGLDVVHVPGHCAGQVALLWRPGRMLFGADAASTLPVLGDPIGFEDIEVGRTSQRKLATLSFDAVGFGHGKPITRDAAAKLRKWTGVGGSQG